jgi:ribosomal-protein-alanine N-acetyltransferase
MRGREETVTAGLSQPSLRTERLVLRPFRTEDAGRASELAGTVEVARETINIPHPYPVNDAEAWIEAHPGQLARREAVTYAITLGDGSELVGAVGLILDTDNDLAELGYWIGKPYWGRGYATEAARAVLDWAFPALDLHRVHASHFPRNPASGRVLRKLGMVHEGRLRQHVKKWGEYLDLERFGLLRSEHDARRRRPGPPPG